MSERIYLFLYGNGNLAGAALGLAGLLLFFTGVIDRWWLAIVAGLYAIGFLAAPRPQQVQLASHREVHMAEIQQALDDLLERAQPHLVQEINQRLQRIRDAIVAVLPALLQRQELGDQELFTLRQTALHYLPESLENYLKLPVAYRRFHTLPDGRTPRDSLIAQLDILEGKMLEVLENAHRADSQALLASERFLREKFRQPEFLKLD